MKDTVYASSVPLPPVWVRGAEDSVAREAAERLGAAVCDSGPGDGSLYLCSRDGALCLCGGDLSLCADLSRMLPRLRPNNLGGELLVRAAWGKRRGEALRAVDATAGFGEDSLLLAASGMDVTLFEYNPVIAELLRDSLRRAAEVPELADAVSRMHLRCADSTVGLRELGFAPDVVLLDPMFPERQKSGSIKKKFQLLQRLECPCSAEEELMAAAKAAHPAKIVIKRPAKGPELAGVRASYSLKGPTVRYDCVVLQHE